MFEWSYSQNRFWLWSRSPKFSSIGRCIMSNHSVKFDKDLISGFWVIQLADKQTNKHGWKQSRFIWGDRYCWGKHRSKCRCLGQRWLLTVAFNLPDSVTHAPQSRHSVQDGRQVTVRDPDEQEDGQAELQDRSDSDHCLGGHPASEHTHDDWEDEVCDAERDHVVADVLDAQSARHVRLRDTRHLVVMSIYHSYVI